LRAAAGGRTEVGESFDAAGAGFVVGDRFGNAVACGFSMNGLFGSGKVLEGTGIVLAAPPPASARGRLPLTMAILGNENIGRARLAASASAGDAAGIDLVQVLLRVLSEDEPPQAAVAAPRVRFLGGDTAAYELGLPGDSLDGLAAAGFDAKAERDPTLINLFFCPEGFVRQEEAAACAIATDPRGNGLAETVR